jgi:hypothetical protein
VLQKALNVASQIRSHYHRALALRAVAGNLSPEDRLRLSQEALVIARQIEHDGLRVEALAVIAKLLDAQESESVARSGGGSAADWKLLSSIPIFVRFG